MIIYSYGDSYIVIHLYIFNILTERLRNEAEKAYS